MSLDGGSGPPQPVPREAADRGGNLGDPSSAGTSANHGPRMNRRSALRASGTVGLLALCGCLGGTSGQVNERTVVDGVGRQVAVPDTVDRVIGLGPGALRQVVYVDGTDRVVGVERGEQADFETLPYNAANPKLGDLPIVGNSGPEAAGDAESILEVDPDVVFLSSIGGYQAADQLTDQTGIPTVVLDMPFLTDADGRSAYFESLGLVGEVLGASERAAALVSDVKSLIADLRGRAPDTPAASAYVGGVSFKGSQGLTTTRVPYAPFSLSGIRNVAREIETAHVSVDVSSESLIAWDPPVVFCSVQNLPLVRQDLRRHPELESLSAIRAGRIHVMPPVSHYHENLGTMLVNAVYVGSVLLPDHFGEWRIGNWADRVYEILLGTSPFETLQEQQPAYQRVSLVDGGG
ncbi:MAG: ABC transporter substrate-binding protein [Halodesulfurarchaeum sp.]|nr:ABC transporter substrate-binding protein [Halodesulfurarchaeum sp.]